MLRELAETYEIEHELGYKVDELKRTIEGMGQLVGDQVCSMDVAHPRLAHRSVRRSPRLSTARFCKTRDGGRGGSLSLSASSLRSSSSSFGAFDARRRTQPDLTFATSRSLTNARTASLLQNVYYDPFYPTLYHVPSDTLAYSLSEPYLSVDTLAAFSPYPRSPSFSSFACVSTSLQRVASVLSTVLPQWPASQETYTSWSEGILVPS